MNFFYRFRSINALIGDRKELEKQEIYFARPDELNDPMEGFKDIVWHGDEIVWKNFFKNYLISLQLAMTIAYLTDDDYAETDFPIVVHATNSTLPTPKVREVHRNICRLFFEDDDAAALPAFLASQDRPIRREELGFYLRIIHGRAIYSVAKVLRAEEKISVGEATLQTSESLANLKSIEEKIWRLNQGKDGSAVENDGLTRVFVAASHLFRQIELQNYFQADTPRKRMWQMICFGYPERYVQHLDDLVYSDWYAACFVADPNHAAMWGNYGDGHKGVCLKFRANQGGDGSSYLNVKRAVAWGAGPNGSSAHFGTAPHRFMRISYVERFVEIDFFRSMGRLRSVALREDWYKDENGKISSCAEEIFSDEENWRRKYWEKFENTVTTKFCDWRHEAEYRIVLNDTLGGFEDRSDRKVTYDFADLAGIIFGINTTLEDRMNVAKVIFEKCRASGRSEFEFSQAYYSTQSGKIETHPLDLQIS